MNQYKCMHKMIFGEDMCMCKKCGATWEKVAFPLSDESIAHKWQLVDPDSYIPVHKRKKVWRKKKK